MGPIKGYRKKKSVKKNEASGSGSSDKDDADWWDVLSKRINGLRSKSNDLDLFEATFKVSRGTFNHIYSLVKEAMVSKPNNYTFSNGKPLPMHTQVAIALRRLSSGDSLATVGDMFRLNHSTVSQITWHFVEAMERSGLRHLQWPSTEAEMGKIKSGFENIQGLPNCCGVVGTTRILMSLSSMDPESKVWLDEEQNHSMILMAIVDHTMRFRDIVTGWPGGLKDAAVFQTSNFSRLCNSGERLNGKKRKLSKNSEIGEYIIGDAGFPLLPYLIVPYRGQELTEQETEFNKRHSGTRFVARRALARLKDQWRIIQGTMWRPDRHRLPRIILVCCLLHNILIDLEDKSGEEVKQMMSDEDDVGYKEQVCESVDFKGVHLREQLSLYLSDKATTS